MTALNIPAPDQPGLARLPIAEIASLHALRDADNLQAAIADDAVWLKWNELGDSVLKELRSIPRLEFWTQSVDDTLRRLEDRLPSLSAPVWHWESLHRLIPVELPPAGFGGAVRERILLSLVPCPQPHPSVAVLTTFSHWSRFAEAAPDFRLRPLRFAATAGNLVLIDGEPLPSLPGTYFYRRGALVIRNGWKLAPVSDPDVIQELLMLDPGDIALIQPAAVTTPHRSPDSSTQPQITIIPAKHFAGATRSAVRSTRQALQTQLTPPAESGSP